VKESYTPQGFMKTGAKAGQEKHK